MHVYIILTCKRGSNSPFFMNFSSKANCQDCISLPANAIAHPVVAPQETPCPGRCVVEFNCIVSLAFLIQNSSSTTAAEPTTPMPTVAITIPSHWRKSLRVRRMMRVVIAHKMRIEQFTTPMIDAGHSIIDTTSHILTHISQNARGTITHRLRQCPGHRHGVERLETAARSISADGDNRG